ncbi:mucus-binding protein [Diplodia corticola]|uniref:Mucus-binding protein n=1 Tax=Diplodia corticola TaxID=236234 RepID=A0A1J9RT73_9PEZI|nr:mucus-binding protein [Diplodia corticola]OJD31631.1 mucus-binding protein [Diplodia corticola]
MVSRNFLASVRRVSPDANQTSRRSFQRTKTTASSDAKCHEQREYSLLSFTYTKPHKCSKLKQPGGPEKPKPTLKAKVKSIVFAMTLCHARKKRRPSAFSVSNDTWTRKEYPDPPELESIERPVELRSEMEPQELEGDYPVDYTPRDEQPAQAGSQPQAGSSDPDIPSIQVTEDQTPLRRSPEPQPQVRRKPRPSGSAELRIPRPVTPAGNGARTTQTPSRFVSRLLVPSSPTTPSRKSEDSPWNPDEAASAADEPYSASQSRIPTSSSAPSTSSPKAPPCPLFSCLCWREHKSDSFNQPLSDSPTSTTSTLVDSRPSSSWLTEKQVYEPPNPDDDGTAAPPKRSSAPLESSKWFERNFQPMFSDSVKAVLKQPLPKLPLFRRSAQNDIDTVQAIRTGKNQEKGTQALEKHRELDPSPVLSEVRGGWDLNPEKTGLFVREQRTPASHPPNVRHVERAKG